MNSALKGIQRLELATRLAKDSRRITTLWWTYSTTSRKDATQLARDISWAYIEMGENVHDTSIAIDSLVKLFIRIASITYIRELEEECARDTLIEQMVDIVEAHELKRNTQISM